jgi:pimeloyl-ACP methyl ester carboxylesterase
MPRFQHGPIEIAYLDEGEGEPIVLVHGFASNKEINWSYPGWLTALKGRRVIALDNRGHGQSSKLYDPAEYHLRRMTEDLRALLDHLRIERADVMGYSMGARITAFLAHDHPERVRSAILGGLGSVLLTGGLSENIADALEAPSLAQVTDPVGRTFRQFGEQTRSDLRALAACLRGSRQRMTEEEAAAINLPVLIAVGTKDAVAGNPHDLARLIPGAQVLEIPNRDHMLAVGDRIYKEGVLKFLEARP